MKVNITPKRLSGEITPPTSKSVAHRLIIAAALGEGISSIPAIDLSQDILATMNCMRALGAIIEGGGSQPWLITGIRRGQSFDSPPELDCGESGSTLRFLIPVALAIAGGGVFTGKGRLMDRPQGPYEQLFAEKGIRFSRESGRIRVEGKLTGGTYRLAGDVSSQFITGLLFALPLLEDDSEIILTTPLESEGYVNLTIDAMKRAGVTVFSAENGWTIRGGQRYCLGNAEAEADYSQAGFYLAAEGIGNEVRICGMNPNSAQGDRIIVDYCQRLRQSGDVTLDVSQCPDLVPPLAVFAALRAGQRTKIVGAARLRIKESDRLDTVTTQLNLLGANIEQFPDALTIHGVEHLNGGIVSGCNDHRIAMMLAVAATRATGNVIIEGAECVSKSYPHFLEDYVKLGGQIERMDG